MKKFFVLFRGRDKEVVYCLQVWGVSFRDVREREIVVSMCNNPRMGDVASLLIIRVIDGEYNIFDV